MESTSKLADLTLVSKYYPIANYSYPRSPGHGPHDSRGSVDRSSFGSADSAPGLIDDRTDSETSAEDDYQYHAHATELWDTFWQSGGERKQEDPMISPKRQYPALIPSPQQRKRQASQENLRTKAWPLPELSSHSRAKRPAATYSPFPKPMHLPARSTRPVPSWTSSRPGGMPQRPPRPENDLLVPCVREPAVGHGIKPARPQPLNGQMVDSHRPATSQEHRLLPPAEDQRSTSSFDTRPATSFESAANSICCMSRSGASSPLYECSYAAASVAHTESQEPEPQSVFECDDSDTESPSRSFFLFHKRAHSDRSAKASDLMAARRRRDRASTTPPRARCQPDFTTNKPDISTRKRQTDVWGRMLGRRSKG